MSVKKINLRLEGGLGDHLLAIRFIPAIKEKYPDAKIKIYSDTAGKTFQRDALVSSYGHLFDEIEVIPAKKHKEFWVDCQFGVDNFYGALENVPDDIRKDMTENCDKFYDLHIDGLKWMNYDFDWLRYFYFFPRPNVHISEKKDRYAVLHLHSATSKGHNLEQFYIDGLVQKISEHTRVVIISTREDNHLFTHLAGDNVTIFNGSVEDVFSIIANADVMVSTDSGFRYIAYGCSVPTITFSKNAQAPHSVPRSHQARWLMYPEQCFPLNYSFTYIAGIVKKILENKGQALFPGVQDFDREMVFRKYTINTEKTK